MAIFLFNTNDPYSREKVNQHLDYLDDKYRGKSKTIRCEMVENRVLRSVPHLRYYWVVLTAIGAKIGLSKEKCHEWFGIKFNPEYMPDGTVVAKSTGDMDDDELGIYIKKIKVYAREQLGVYIMEQEDAAYLVWERQSKSNYNDMFRSLDE